MKREEYDRYVSCFNARDLDGVFDFFHDNPRIAFFGIEIRSRQQLKDFYNFLHQYVKETITVEKFASSDDFVALEALVRIEGIQDLDAQTLEAKGFGGLFPIAKGQVQEMRQYIHYQLQDGKFVSVGCAIPVE